MSLIGFEAWCVGDSILVSSAVTSVFTFAAGKLAAACEYVFGLRKCTLRVVPSCTLEEAYFAAELSVNFLGILSILRVWRSPGTSVGRATVSFSGVESTESKGPNYHIRPALTGRAQRPVSASKRPFIS